jgi:predicted porin
MQKKLIVLALASAFAAPTFAATANVDIYGQLDVSIDYISGLGGYAATTSSGGADNHAWRLSSNTSRIGLKGSEDLGGGLAAIWQFEQQVVLDKANVSGWSSQRNTFLGMKGGFGTVLLGTHDTPYKLATASLDPFADTMGDYNAIMGSFQGANTSDLRLGNVLAYISPTFSGFTGAIATSFLKETGMKNLDGSPSAWTGMVNYANGPIYVAGGFEQAKHVGTSALGGIGDLNLTSWKLGGGYTFGNFVVNAMYERIKADINAGPFTLSTSAKRSSYGLNGVYNMGNIALKAGWYHAGKVSDWNNSGANMFELGGDYNLSKRTKLYAVYAKVNNDANGLYCVGGSLDAGFGGSNSGNAVCGGAQGSTSWGNQVNGKDPSAFSIGMRHTF